MSIQAIANSYALALGRRMKDVAVPELFNGDSIASEYRLALDYTVPVILVEGWHYKFRLVARVQYIHPENGWTNKRIFTEGHFEAGDIANFSPFTLEAKAQAHVSNMKRQIEKLTRPTFMLIQSGDYWGCHPEMQRLWL